MEDSVILHCVSSPLLVPDSSRGCHHMSPPPGGGQGVGKQRQLPRQADGEATGRLALWPSDGGRPPSASTFVYKLGWSCFRVYTEQQRALGGTEVGGKFL